MALPIYYPFKTRIYNATQSSSNGIAAVAIAARAKLVTALVVTGSSAAQTAAGTIDITVNGSTASGLTGIAVTTSTGNGSTVVGSPTKVTYLNVGDVLATVASSVVGYTATFVVQEF